MQEISAWGEKTQTEALRQIAGLCSAAWGLDLKLSGDRAGFTSQGSKPGDRGVLSCQGRIRGERVVVRAVVARAGPCPADAASLFGRLAGLGAPYRLLAPQQDEAAQEGLALEVSLPAEPLAPTRAASVGASLETVARLGRELQQGQLRPPTEGELRKQYQACQGVLELVEAWDLRHGQAPAELDAWAGGCADLLEGGASLAVVQSSPAELGPALAALAAELRRRGGSLGRLVQPGINTRSLLELAGKAPGVVTLPATSLSTAASPYEMGGEVETLLEGLGAQARPAVFTGGLSRLQAVFHGGQGAAHDPLRPVVTRPPELALDAVSRYAVLEAADRASWATPGAVEGALDEVRQATAHLAPPEAKRLIPLLARAAVARGRRGGAGGGAAELARRAGQAHETLGGLAPRPRARRSSPVQARQARLLSGPAVRHHLGRELVGQEAALDRLAARLATEALTRPPHQPLRYCVQGTPGTGKSESAALLARLLEIPYVNIDAASMPDYHTAASQLLGSGRGIVMSHLPGRLEQVAKHHAGAVVEVSDLDHAPARVRAPLADLFLQLLETGEAQSATGAGFSCVNLILVFSMNLPGGADEEVRKAIGFGGPPAEEQVLRNVMREIKLAFSGAFLSRVGRPILFAPLGREDLAAILERTLAKALAAGAERLGWGRPAVELDPGLGTRLAGALPREEDSLGARAVHEQGRLLAAQALSRLSQKKSPDQLQRLRAGCGPRGELELNAE